MAGQLSLGGARAPQGRRRAAALALLLAVTLAHLWVSNRLAESRIGLGAADTAPRRIEVAFVRELAQSNPPPLAPTVLPRRTAHKAAPAPAPAASEPAEAAPPDLALPLPEPALAAAPDAAPAASATLAEAPPGPAAAASAADTATAFEWPPSTRLTYLLTGNYRGPVEGNAQVEWLRSGSRYQVHLDVGVGPKFAPLMTRRMSSDGELTELGLAPRRYDEETRVALREPRRSTVQFEAGRVILADGREQERLPGLQDTASQFVQMTWLFTTHPERLKVGESVDMPLALPRRVGLWVYDNIGRETLNTPAGPIDTFHMKPRGEVKPGSELSAEMWFAPSLQYLPVRIRIRQDAEVYVDLMIERLPQQSAPP